MVESSGVGGNMLGTEAMTCQELLALSGALSAALPTGQLGLGSFFTSLSKGGKMPYFDSLTQELNSSAQSCLPRFFTGILIFKGLTARRLYKSLGVKR
jgi:hypothetical protein